MLRVRGVAKSFRVGGGVVEALRGVDLDVDAGRVTAILGASGSGKTTLLKVIAGFERPDRGEVRLGDRVLVGPSGALRPEQRGIGVVAQDGSLFPHLDVAGNVGYGLGPAVATWLRPQRRRARADHIARALELVGLAGYERRRVDELSGGQQQRVALARTLLPRPAVVLLDEPFSALDASLRAELGAEVRDLLNRLEITTVLVTHDQQEALSLATSVAVMRDGRVVQAGAPTEIYRRPLDTETARFVGDAVVLDGQVRSVEPGGTVVDSPLGTLIGTAPDHLAVGGRCAVVIRPQHFALGTEGTPALVAGTDYFGHQVLTRLRLGSDGTGPEIRVRSDDGELASPGAVTHVTVSGPVLILPLAGDASLG